MKAASIQHPRHASGAPRITPRHVWLAGLGLTMLAGKGLGSVAEGLGRKAGALHLRLIDLSGRARDFAHEPSNHSI